jgi:hypothetical protein
MPFLQINFNANFNTLQQQLLNTLHSATAERKQSLDRGVGVSVWMPCKFRPARQTRGNGPRSRRLWRLSIYTDTLGVQTWSVRAKTVEKKLCVNVANVCTLFTTIFQVASLPTAKTLIMWPSCVSPMHRSGASSRFLFTKRKLALLGEVRCPAVPSWKRANHRKTSAWLAHNLHIFEMVHFCGSFPRFEVKIFLVTLLHVDILDIRLLWWR